MSERIWGEFREDVRDSTRRYFVGWESEYLSDDAKSNLIEIEIPAVAVELPTIEIEVFTQKLKKHRWKRFWRWIRHGRKRQLKAKYTLESPYDLQQAFGKDTVQEITDEIVRSLLIDEDIITGCIGGGKTNMMREHTEQVIREWQETVFGKPSERKLIQAVNVLKHVANQLAILESYDQPSPANINAWAHCLRTDMEPVIEFLTTNKTLVDTEKLEKMIATFHCSCCVHRPNSPLVNRMGQCSDTMKAQCIADKVAYLQGMYDYEVQTSNS